MVGVMDRRALNCVLMLIDVVLSAAKGDKSEGNWSLD